MWERFIHWIAGFFKSPDPTVPLDDPFADFDEASVAEAEQDDEEFLLGTFGDLGEHVEDSWNKATILNRLSTTVERFAQEGEADQTVVEALMEEHGRELVASASNAVDWDDLIESYPDELLTKIRQDGSNWAFTPRLGKLILHLVRVEQSERGLYEKVSGHGMAEDGTQS